MKLLHKISGCFCIVITLLIFQSCTKQSPKLKAQQQTDFSNSALVQVYIATVNASGVNIFVDAAQITGATLSSGGVFPPGAGAIATNVQQGLRAFLVTTATPLSFAENMASAKFHTIFVYDTITTPLQKTIQTNIVIPSDTTARLRFANFVFAKTAIPAIDIFSARKNANVATNLQVTDVTDFIPHPSKLADTFYVRLAGSGVNLLNGTTPIRSIFTPTSKRSYTLVFRGSYANPSATAGQVRTLSVFTNY